MREIKHVGTNANFVEKYSAKQGENEDEKVLYPLYCLLDVIVACL